MPVSGAELAARFAPAIIRELSAGEPYATQSGKARVTAAVRLDTCSLV